MIAAPAALGAAELRGWRLDDSRFAGSWDSGEGAFRAGGRWNSKGIRVVYAAVDAATAILEVAVHKSFRVLDTVPHVMTGFLVDMSSDVHVVDPGSVPNPNWLRPGIPGAGQQSFGDGLIADHDFVLIPSAVSTHSWNIIFDPVRAAVRYKLEIQEPFALDTRLHPVI